MNNPAPILVDERTAAQLLGVSPRTIWTLRQRGELPYVRVGPRLVRYRPADLERWAAERAAAHGGSRHDAAGPI